MIFEKGKFYKVEIKKDDEVFLCEYHSSEASQCGTALIHNFICRDSDSYELKMANFYDYQIDAVRELPDGMIL